MSYKARVAGSETPFAEAEDISFTVSEGLLVPAIKVRAHTSAACLLACLHGPTSPLLHLGIVWLEER